MDSPPLGIFPDQVVLTERLLSLLSLRLLLLHMEVLHIITMGHHAACTDNHPPAWGYRSQNCWKNIWHKRLNHEQACYLVQRNQEPHKLSETELAVQGTVATPPADCPRGLTHTSPSWSPEILGLLGKNTIYEAQCTLKVKSKIYCHFKILKQNVDFRQSTKLKLKASQIYPLLF